MMSLVPDVAAALGNETFVCSFSKSLVDATVTLFSHAAVAETHIWVHCYRLVLARGQFNLPGAEHVRHEAYHLQLPFFLSRVEMRASRHSTRPAVRFGIAIMCKVPTRALV